MRYPSLGFFRSVFGSQVDDFRSRPIQVGAISGRVERVSLDYAAGSQGPEAIVVKIVDLGWGDDPNSHVREARYYTEIAPRLALPRPMVYHVGEEEAGRRVIVMEDLRDRYAFPPPGHRWNDAEMRSLLRSYALLHSRGSSCLPPPKEREWLLPRYEVRIRDERIPGLAAALTARGFWGPIPGIERLYRRTREAVADLAEHPVTLLHNDTYPPNCGLPVDLEGGAMLIDWGMLSWGWAELDLAYLFMQPYGASEDVDREAALGYYWALRAGLGGDKIPMSQRLEIQRWADAALALALVIVAHGRSEQPLPPNSPARAYWDSMYGVLHKRLVALAEWVDRIA